MHLNSKNFTAITLIVILFLFGCTDDKTPSEVVDDDNNADDLYFKYLALNITCYNSHTGITNGTSADVVIYDQTTRTQVFLGNSTPTGYFCTPTAIDSRILYRVEIFKFNSDECVMAFWNVSLFDSPNCWVDSYGDTAIATCHMGDCDKVYSDEGCWGK